MEYSHPDSKIHGVDMGPTWVLLAPDGPHVGPMNLAPRAPLTNGGSRNTDIIVNNFFFLNLTRHILHHKSDIIDCATEPLQRYESVIYCTWYDNDGYEVNVLVAVMKKRIYSECRKYL